MSIGARVCLIADAATAALRATRGGAEKTSAVIARIRFGVAERLAQFIKFCLVGGSGVVVDMAVLYLLADPKMLALNLTLSKVCAAETALVNNFIWNEVWTFRARAATARRPGGVLRRLLLFNAICGAGIFLAVLLLHLFHTLLGWNLYLSNLVAIALVTLWNFGLNARFNWSRKALDQAKSSAEAPRRSKAGKLVLITLCFVGFSSHGAPPQLSIPSFRIDGKVTTVLFRHPRTTNATDRVEAAFKFWYSNGWWQIECTFLSPEDVAGIVENCSRISDGVRYAFLQTNNNNGNPVIPTAAACATPFPPATKPEFLITWLTLCPNAELPVADDRRMRRFSQPGLLNRPKNMGYYEAAYLGGINLFLAELYFANNGYVPVSSGEFAQCSGAFKAGYLESSFRVDGTTNFMGITFPARATLCRYVPRPHATNNTDLIPSAVITLEIAGIGVLNPEELREHALPARLIALDRRAPHLPDGVTVNHFVTNDQWPSSKDPRMQRLAAAYIGGARSPRVYRWLWVSTFLVVATFPAIAYLCYKFSLKKNPKNKQ